MSDIQVEKTDLTSPNAVPAVEHQDGHHGNNRQYVSGAGAISIAFLLELLKLNTLIRNDMAELNEETVKMQGVVTENQAQAQISLYTAQSKELLFQMGSTIASSVVSGFGLIGGLATGFGTKASAAEASVAQEQLGSFAKIKTEVSLNTSDGRGGQHAEFEIEQANLKQLREQLTIGDFDTKSFGGAKDLTSDTAEMKVGDRSYTLKEIIGSATPEEKLEINKQFVKLRDNANTNNLTAQQKWQNNVNFAEKLGQIVSGGTSSAMQAGQSDAKKAEGAAAAINQEAQGAAQVLSSAQDVEQRQRAAAQDNNTQELRTIRELVASQVQG